MMMANLSHCLSGRHQTNYGAAPHHPPAPDQLYAQLAAPSVTFVRGPPGDDQALQAWAQLLTEG